MNQLFLASLFFLLSCTPESFITSRGEAIKDIIPPARPIQYELGVTENARLLYMYKTSSTQASYFIEDNKIDTTRFISHFERALMAESYHYVNYSQKGDRYFFLNAAGQLFYTKDGINATRIFTSPIFNQSLTNFIFPRGIYFNQKLTGLGINPDLLGDAYYFNGDTEVVEKITTRLELSNGSMPIDSAAGSFNLTSQHCIDNPSSCTDTAYTWVSRVIFPESKDAVIGIASRKVRVGPADRLIPTYAFRVTHTGFEKKLITGLSLNQLVELENFMLVGRISGRIYRTPTDLIWSSSLSTSSSMDSITHFFGISKSDLTLSVKGVFTGTKNPSVLGAQYPDEDLSSSYIYPTYRHTVAGATSFHFYYNNQWMNSPQLDSIINGIQNPTYTSFISLKKHEGGWSFTFTAGSMKSLIWCNEDLSSCSEIANFAAAQLNFIFMDDQFSYQMTPTELRKFEKGVLIKTYVFDDEVVGKEGIGLLSYREGSLCVIRYSSDLTDGSIYLMNQDFEVRDKLHHGNLESNSWTNDEEEKFIVAYHKLVNLTGAWFVLRDQE